jgi:hypothetical protein
MKTQTEAFKVQVLLDCIEGHVSKMPKAYGESFRHIMHRDLYQRLTMYTDVARRRIQPAWCDPRFVATRA